MPMFGFGKKADTKSKTAPESKEDDGPAAGIAAPDVKKSRRFFEHAHSVADTGNFDFAIQMFLEGLDRAPTNLDEHQALREASLKRKVKGGKPAGMMEAMKLGGGKTVVERMHNALYLLSKDPGNAQHMIAVIDSIAKVHKALEEAHGLSMREIMKFYMSFTMEAVAANESLAKKAFVQMYKSAHEAGDLDNALEALSFAVKVNPDDGQLVRDLKNLQAELTEEQGKYGQTDQDFRQSVRDLKGQMELHQEEQMVNSGGSVDAVIQRQRQFVQENPDDVDAYQKLVNTLVNTEKKENEDEGIKVLQEAYERFEQYRFKMRIGDIKMKQYNRVIRAVNEQIHEDPSNSALKEKRQKMMAAKLKFEMGEYGERTKRYPNDMSVRYELGVRQFSLQKFDDAIASFQGAQNDPKYRGRALFYLGRAFMQRSWFNEAIDSLNKAIEAHPLNDDTLGKEMRYHLMIGLMNVAKEERNIEKGKDAQKIASEIAQLDFNYKDIRDKMDEIRGLVNELRG